MIKVDEKNGLVIVEDEKGVSTYDIGSPEVFHNLGLKVKITMGIFT